MISRFEPDALREFVDAMKYLDEQRVGLGDELHDEVYAALNLILEQPDRWPLYVRQVRRYRLKRFRYHINYRFDSQSLTVVAFTHTSREPGYWKHRI